MKPNRCPTHDGFIERLEEFRAPTAEEVARHPYVGANLPRVARARCNACERDVLAIDWSTP